MSLMFSVSATTPCPAKAASPCMRMGRTEYASGSLIVSCLARTIPTTTGSTASRWLGLAASSTVTSLPERETNFPTWPRWYFTSPEPCMESGSTWPSNSLKIWS